MLNRDLKGELWELYKSLGQEALTLSHYDLAEKTEVDQETWKEFLMDTEVIDWIAEEIKLISEAEFKKMVQNVSKSRSVGHAQLMNALAKINESKEGKKEGPAFIYTYVPLSTQQEGAPNTRTLPTDVFLAGGDE